MKPTVPKRAPKSLSTLTYPSLGSETSYLLQRTFCMHHSPFLFKLCFLALVGRAGLAQAVWIGSPADVLRVDRARAVRGPTVSCTVQPKS